MKQKIYELLYYLDPVIKIKGTLMGFITQKQFADLMKDPKDWASKIGSAAHYSIEDLGKTLSKHENVRLIVRFEDTNDKNARKLFITDELAEGNTYNISVAQKAFALTDESHCHIQVM